MLLPPSFFLFKLSYILKLSSKLLLFLSLYPLPTDARSSRMRWVPIVPYDKKEEIPWSWLRKWWLVHQGGVKRRVQGGNGSKPLQSLHRHIEYKGCDCGLGNNSQERTLAASKGIRVESVGRLSPASCKGVPMRRISPFHTTLAARLGCKVGCVWDPLHPLDVKVFELAFERV